MPKTSQMTAVLRHNLVQDADVHAIADGRVYSGHGKEAEEATRQQPVVILERRGGNDFAQAAAGQRVVWVYAYSNHSLDEAQRLYEAAKDVLQRKGLKGRLDQFGDPCEDVCIYAIEQAGTFDGYNRDVCAHFVRGTWTVWGMG